MAKVTLKTINSGYYSTDDLNQNFSALQAELENSLSRDGTTPNQVLADIDMNSHSFYNVKEGATPAAAVTKNQVEKMISEYSPSYIASYSEHQVAVEGQKVFNLLQLKYLPNINNIDVYINGVLQRTATDFDETSETVITFPVGLPAGDVVTFRVNPRKEIGTLDVETLSGSVVLSVPTIADLRALTTNKKDVFVKGLVSSSGSSHGGQFYWDSNSTAVDDGVNAVLPNGHTGPGRWVRSEVSLRDAVAPTNPVTKRQFDTAPVLSDFTNDRVVSGLVMPTSTTLSSTVSEGTSWVLGKRVVTTATTLTFDASSDTYVDLSNTGVFTLAAVANGGAEPAVTANSLRIFKAVTDATAITSVTFLAKTLLRVDPLELLEIGDSDASLKRFGPDVQVESDLGSFISAGLTQSQQAANAVWDGTNWVRLDTAQPASLLVLDRNSTLNLFTAPAAANPIAWSGPYPVIRGGMSYSTATLSANQAIAAATFTKIAFDTEDLDILGDYDTAAFRFVVPELGIYNISAAAQYTGNADAVRSIIALYVNGAETRRGTDIVQGGASDTGVTVSTTMRLAAGDYIEVFGYCSAASTIRAFARTTWFTVSRVQ